MKIICSLILSITSLLSARAAIFQGTVLDQKSKKPIQALIYTRENYNWHTRTQESGYFKLMFPDTVRDSIIIFSPGYEIVVTAWESDDSSHTYYLERLPHLSDDDLLSLQEVNLKMLAEEAIASLWSNIPDKPHELGAFCRVTSSNEGQVVSVSEAAITIFDDAYARKPDLAQIQIDEMRQSVNKDTSRYRLLKEHHKKFWTDYGPVRQHPLPVEVMVALGGAYQMETQFERTANGRGIKAE